MSEKERLTLHVYLGDKYLGPITPDEVSKDSVWVTDGFSFEEAEKALRKEATEE